MISGFRYFLCFSAIMILANPAIADEKQRLGVANSGGDQEQQALPRYSFPVLGTGDAACSFKTHDCELCTKDSGKIICSSVGIACEPTEWRCLEPAEAK